MLDKVVPQDMMPKNNSMAKIEIDGAKIKGVRWLNKKSNVNALPEESKPKVLHKELKKNMGDSLNSSDIMGSSSKPLPKSKKNQIDSLDVQDIVKPRKVANMFQSLDAVPIKDKLGEDVVKKPTPINTAIYKDEQRQMTLGGRMQDAMNYFDVYENRGNIKAKAIAVTTTPRVKDAIIGSSPRKMTFTRSGTDFRFQTLDVDGATPMKKTHNTGAAIEGFAAGQMPQARRGLKCVTPLNKEKSNQLGSFIFSTGGSFGGSLPEKKSFAGSGTQRHANSNGIKGIFGGSQYGDYEAPDKTPRR